MSYQCELPRRVICDSLAREFTKLLLLREGEDHPYMLIHTSDVDSSSLSMKMNHYVVEEKEDFIKLFSDDSKPEIYTIPMEVINSLGSGAIEDKMLNRYIRFLNDIYDFMDTHNFTSTDYAPPIRMVEVEEKEEKA